MRLHIRKGAIEQAFGALDRKLFGDIYVFAAAIIPAPRVSFRVFVGEDGALRLQYCAGDDVLGGNQFDLLLLAPKFAVNRAEYFWIGAREALRKKPGGGALVCGD